MNLVTGATGLLGSEICRLLTEAGKPTTALVRVTSDPEKVGRLKKLGVKLVQGDLKNSASLDSASKGVSAVISTVSSTFSRQEGDSIQTVDLEGQINLIDAAIAAGVEKFVFISFRENPDIQFPLNIAKRKVEKHLSNSGMDWTSLQASWFMEIWLSPAIGFDFVNANARIYGDGNGKISWISFKDVARFAVASLHNPAAKNKIIEVGGPEALSPLQVVKVFEDVSGRKFTIEKIPEETLLSQKAGAQDPLQESFAGLMLRYASGDAINMKQA